MLAVTAAIYLPTLRFGFVADDNALIVDNSRLVQDRPWRLFGREFAHGAGQAHQMRVSYYRPLVNLSFWFERRLWGLRPLGYHLTNVLLHALAAGLLFLILLRLHLPIWISLLAGLLFGLHPMHVESVAYVSGRTDLLAAVFLFASFLSLLAVRTVRPARRGLVFALSCLFYLCALLSKEVALVWLPFSVLWLFNRRRDPDRPWNRLLIPALAAISVLYLLVRSSVVHSPAQITPGVTLHQFPLLMLNTLGLYLRLLLFPLLHQPYYPLDAGLLAFGPGTAGALLALVAVVFLWLRPGLRLAALGLAWLVLFLLPVLNLLFLSGPAAAERFLLIPSAGLVIAFAALADRFRPRDLTGGFVAVATCLALAVIFGAGSLSYAPTWRNDLSLARAMVRASPDFAMAHNNLGVACRNRGELGPARQAFETAIRLKPDYAEPHNNLGSLLEAGHDLTAAIASYRRAIELDPGFTAARNNLGSALGMAGQPDSAIAWFRSVLRIDPDNAEAHNNLGVALAGLNRTGDAINEFRAAIRLNPDYVRALVNLSRLLLRAGDRAEAVEFARRAASIAPTDQSIRSLLLNLSRQH